MNKKIMKLFALVLALVMVVSLFAGCKGGTETPTDPSKPDDSQPTEPNQPEKADTLVYATATFGQKFSPFFATTAYDMEVVDLTQGGLLASDR